MGIELKLIEETTFTLNGERWTLFKADFNEVLPASYSRRRYVWGRRLDYREHEMVYAETLEELIAKIIGSDNGRYLLNGDP